MDKSMNIDSTALELLKIINSHSYDAYIVGGAIRDLLLGITPTDYDICTNMPISMLLTLFPYDDIEVSGQLFLSIKLRYKNKIFEITNTRIEGEYKKSGYPSKVTLTDSIHEDLKRRDFTINAIAYSLKDGIIDDFNSVKDLENKLLKTIRNPSTRFKEDPTRILRGIRFASMYNLQIENDTYNAMKTLSTEIKKLTYPKVIKEFYKILSLENISDAISYLDEIDFFELMWGLKTKLKEKYKNNIEKLKLSTNSVDSRLAILFKSSSINI